MKPDEIIKSLRWLAKDTEFTFAAEQLDEAAYLIESLQARLDAAVEDLRHMDNCEICLHYNAMPEECDTECLGCKLPCVCGDCRDESLWQWRGQDARKGVAHGEK